MVRIECRASLDTQRGGEATWLRTTETSHRPLVATAFACRSPTPRRGGEAKDGRAGDHIKATAQEICVFVYIYIYRERERLIIIIIVIIKITIRRRRRRR